jgi:two-component sensor histidine kinase
MIPVGSADPIGAIGAYWDHCHEATAEEIEILEAIAGACTTAIENARLLAALSHALSEAELARDELRHRLKNVYASATALAMFLLPEEYALGMARRLAGLARAHALLDGRISTDARVPLRTILDVELAPYATDVSDRIALNGPDVALKGPSATTLALAVNELATNALKYGALSAESGRLTIDWAVDGDRLRIRWLESDGPETASAAVENVGSRLLRRLVEGQLRGTISRKLVPNGLRCELDFPLDDTNRGHLSSEPRGSA